MSVVENSISPPPSLRRTTGIDRSVLKTDQSRRDRTSLRINGPGEQHGKGLTRPRQGSIWSFPKSVCRTPLWSSTRGVSDQGAPVGQWNSIMKNFCGRSMRWLISSMSVQEPCSDSSTGVTSLRYRLAELCAFQNRLFWTGLNAGPGIIWVAWSQCHLRKEKVHATL